ncbi:hypothetical protein K8I28_13330 [bacterium]|nr:hypothetical protein [bacterium]
MNASRDIFAGLIDQQREPMIRTTFTLTPDAITALQWLQDELGVQTKDIADIALCNKEPNGSPGKENPCIDDILVLISEASGTGKDNFTERKNLSLHKHSVDTLNQLVRHYEIPRDVFVNQMILHARECLETTLQQRIEDRRKLALALEGWIRDAENLLPALASKLSENDACRELAESIVQNAKVDCDDLCTKFL